VTKPEHRRRPKLVQQPVQVMEISGRLLASPMFGPVHDIINERDGDFIRGFAGFSSVLGRFLGSEPPLGDR
jgi:hypothetical protein